MCSPRPLREAPYRAARAATVPCSPAWIRAWWPNGLMGGLSGGADLPGQIQPQPPAWVRIRSLAA